MPGIPNIPRKWRDMRPFTQPKNFAQCNLKMINLANKKINKKVSEFFFFLAMEIPDLAKPLGMRMLNEWLPTHKHPEIAKLYGKKWLNV